MRHYFKLHLTERQLREIDRAVSPTPREILLEGDFPEPFLSELPRAVSELPRVAESMEME